MSDNKHTPGPWIIEKAMDGSANFAVSSKEGDCYNWQELSTVYNNHSVKEESAANVKLIAAAPDLLEALQRFVKYADGQKAYQDEQQGYKTNFESSMVLQAKAAIQKATKQ